jgi:hypothetical protein
MPNPQFRRADLSHCLIHLTRRRVDARGKSTSAFQALKEILQSGTIRGGSGYVKGGHSVVCLSEIPFSALREFTAPPTEKARYEPYGIVIGKESVFEAGGRPVIYLPDKEATWIPSNERWRHVRFEAGSVDFTHEREWRMLGDLNLNSVAALYVFVWTPPEARSLYDLVTPVKNKILGILPLRDLVTVM